MRAILPIAALLFGGCNPDPGDPDQQVGYRVDGVNGQGDSGERGNVVITEVLWSGSVKDDGTWDRDDVFIELRNQGNRPINLSGWFLELTGPAVRSWQLPAGDAVLDVGEHGYVARGDSPCFPSPDWVIDDLFVSNGDPFAITLRDADERLIEGIGSDDMPPFAGGYDLVVSRSMERVELMFGGAGNMPQSWHYYTTAEVDVPNNDNVSFECRRFTHASPGSPNSPDYSGAYASGSLE
jgi:hypothetical protein